MAVQSTGNITNKPFIIGKTGVAKTGTLAQISGRGVVALAQYTLMSYNPATAKWHPFTSASATDGTQTPSGICMYAVTAAALVAGDVIDIPILIGDAIIDSDQLVIENSLTLATVITVPTNGATNVEDALKHVGIYCSTTVDTTEFEA